MRLEHLCVQYLEACIGHRNVLIALQNAAKLKLDFLKVNWYFILTPCECTNRGYCGLIVVTLHPLKDVNNIIIWNVDKYQQKRF